MAKSKEPKIIVIVGPTASGKSDLAISIAKKLNGEIISADSRQVYKNMDIGTGKVKRDSIKYKVLSIKDKKIESEYYSSGIRHHLIDVANPKRTFTVSQYKKLGEKAVKNILKKNKVPIIVGGTGFYIDVLLGRISIAEVPPDKKLRAKLEKRSVEQLFKRLRKLDPIRAAEIDSKNKRRLIRALEIVITTKRPVPKYLIHNTKYDILWLGLNPKNLEKIIKTRLEKRLKQGIVREVKNLIKSGVNKKRLYDLGLEYRWVNRYLNKEVNYKEMVDGLLRDIIKYSKRQMTWFKRNKDIRWIKSRREVGSLVKEFLFV